MAVKSAVLPGFFRDAKDQLSRRLLLISFVWAVGKAEE